MISNGILRTGERKSMKKKLKKILVVTLLLFVLFSSSLVSVLLSKDTVTAEAATARQVENLDRGLVAVKTGSGMFLSWRLLGTEAYSTSFNVYRNGTKIASNISTSTNYLDSSGSISHSYYVVSVVNGNEVTKSNTISAWPNQYLDVSIDKPAGGSNASGGYTYSASDASVGDLDGDGEYEIILKWEPSNAKDNSQSGHTGNVYIDAYKLNGTRLWRIDLGCNIRAGAHYTQIMVYDLDGDGKAEVACKTAPGSKDATGAYVKAGSNNTTDYRNSNGYVLSGDEYLTIFEGQSGKKLQTINYTPARGNVSSWGDNYGNRLDRYLACIAYLDGKTPSLVMCRGYYTRAVLVAYDWNGSSLNQRWVYDTGSSTSTTATAYGQGAHSLSVADVDNDGFDEIIYGSAVIDNQGSLLHSTGHGHGDALHVSDFNNDNKQEIYMVHESNTTYAAELREGSTGKVLASTNGSGDTGRGLIANITSSSGSEFWSTANNNLYNITGKSLGMKPSSANFAVWWDGDLYRELLDGTNVSKYNESSKSTNRVISFSGVHSNNGTKSTPSLQADIFGDWREEVIMAGSGDNYLRIYTSNITTNSKLYTLMHDVQYREAIAWQNVAYNQPPHTSYYIGNEMKVPTKPFVYTVGNNATPPTEKEDVLEGTYYIKNINSNLYMDVKDGSSENSTNIQQWEYNGSHAQKFKIVSDGSGYYYILTGASGYTSCVDVAGNKSADGTNVLEWTYSGKDNQKYKIIKNSDGTYSFLTKASDCDSALDVYDSSRVNGGNINQWSFWGGSAQKFNLIVCTSD
jgi:rhamnogalacturonan endolyase